MPLQPIEELVKDAAVARLKTIAGDSSYWSVPQDVKRSLGWITVYKASEMPLLGVVRASGTTIRMVAQPDDPGLSVYWAHDIRFAVWGYDAGDHETVVGPTAVDTKLARLREDTIRCLLSDDTLGGLCMNLQPDPDEFVDTDDGALEPLGYFKQIWLAQVWVPIPPVA